MNTTKKVAVLFDFDGVIMDTETQYTRFWNEQGSRYLQFDDFGPHIKGQTLVQIYQKYFADRAEVQQHITRDLDLFEQAMSYEYIPGVEAFIADLRRNSISVAVVTSSSEVKMAHVYRAHPTFKQQFDRILTSEMFAHSKPHPDCFLLGMQLFGTEPQHTFVFEDSFHGLQAGRSSGARVVGLATTNPRQAIETKADYVIDDFRQLTVEKLFLAFHDSF